LPRTKCKGGNHYTTNHSGYCGLCKPKQFDHRFEGQDQSPYNPPHNSIWSQAAEFRQRYMPGPCIEKGEEDGD
jgi:hypothetical protein